ETILFKFTNAVCKSYDESRFKINKCRLRAVSRNVSTFNYNATNLYRINDVQIKLQILKKANGYKPWIINADIDACRFLKGSYNPIAKVIFNMFKEFSNINHSCPFLAGHIIIDGFYLRSSSLPHTIPTGEYLTNITWTFNKQFLVVTGFYFMFIEDLL
ncbi:hypothetical protein KR044_008788, partial [Drosophila immigrans]